MRYLIFFLFCFFAFQVSAQNDLLAKNYFEQGDYEKALVLYKKLSQQNPSSYSYLLNYVKTLQQLEQFQEAEKILEEALQGRRVLPQLFIELGYNYALQKKDSLASKSYRDAINFLPENPAFAYNLGEVFLEYGLLDQAQETYETAMKLDPERDFSAQLARIYGEQGDLEKMFDTYLDLLTSRPTYRSIVKRNFSGYITEDSNNEANQILRKTLLKKLQQNPDILYNEFLSWLFIQQKDFKKAFVQEKAIFARTEENLSSIMDLAMIALDEKNYEDALEIVGFIVTNASNPLQKIDAERQLMNIKLALVETKEYPKIEAQYKTLLSNYGDGSDTYLLQIDYFSFLAFQYNQQEQAISGLKSLYKKQLSPYQEARVKIKLADILVFEEKFNEALIYYSQVQNKVKNDVLAQEARFKVARTSYFKGDFEWAQIQLDVLKKSASQLIANDAMQLSLMIRDNSLEDSTQTALKKFATADLKALQQKNEEALLLLQDILTQHKGEKIEDEALLKMGMIYESQNQLDKAETQYLKLIEFYKEDILADDAHFKLATIYEKLEQPEKAKQLYEQIIFNYKDSIFFVEARKRYRMLRGDEIN